MAKLDVIKVVTDQPISDSQRSQQRKFFTKARIPLHRVRWSNRLTPLLPHEKTIVINGFDALLEATVYKRKSLHLCRGSVYTVNDRPAIVTNDIKQTKWGPVYSSFLWQQDANKIGRYFHGRKRPQPKFHYEIADSLSAISRLEEACRSSLFVSVDVETEGAGSNSHITCVGYGVWENADSLHCFVVPFYRGDREDRRYFAGSRLEQEIRNCLVRVNRLDIPKVLQNGVYDAHYFIREEMPLSNWFLDTAVASHALRQEAPKKLDVLASIYMDEIQYWKDENREETESKDDIKAKGMPSSTEGMIAYWRYNGLDIYTTACITPRIFAELRNNPYAIDNYKKTIRHSTGPALAMSLRGVLIDEGRRSAIINDAIAQAEKALAELRVATNDDDFNPRSPKQIASLLYDVIKTKPIPRKKRSTGEPVLKNLRTQGFLERRLIDYILAAKKPQNIVSKYGPDLKIWNGRLYYSLQPTGTKFLRYSSKKSNFHVGTQIQNLNKDGPLRGMLCADPGYILFEADYTASDAYFTAFSTDEQAYIENLLGPKDLHCLHAAAFFGLEYQDIFDRYKAEDPAIVHSTTGLRQISKKTGYAANYLAGAYTLYIEMGRDAVVSAAAMLGRKNPESLSLKELVDVCLELLVRYFRMYRGIKSFLRKASLECQHNNSWATCIGGIHAKFMGSFKDDETKRNLASFYGQGGTAANILEATTAIWDSDWETHGGMLLFQVHDSLVGQVPEDKPEMMEEVREHMTIERTAPSGKKFTVPVEIKYGSHWGKGMKDLPRAA